MLIEEGHWYQLRNGDVGQASRDPISSHPWLICGAYLNSEGQFHNHDHSEWDVVAEVFAPRVIEKTWWEEAGLKDGDWVQMQSGMVLQFSTSRAVQPATIGPGDKTWFRKRFRRKVTLCDEHGKAIL